MALTGPGSRASPAGRGAAGRWFGRTRPLTRALATHARGQEPPWGRPPESTPAHRTRPRTCRRLTLGAPGGSCPAAREPCVWMLCGFSHTLGRGTTGRGSSTVRAERPLLHAGGRASWATGSRGLLPGMLAPGPQGGCVSQGVEDTGRSPGWEGAGGRDRGARGLGHLAWGARAGM